MTIPLSKEMMMKLFPEFSLESQKPNQSRAKKKKGGRFGDLYGADIA